MTKVHKVVLLVVDDDNLGADGVSLVLQNTHYSNYCISPTVMGVDTVEVQWSDDHPLNNFATMSAAFEKLFKEEAK